MRLSSGEVYTRRPIAPQPGQVLVAAAVPIGSCISQGPHIPHWYR
jgi:hypothetical protein